MKCEGLYTIRRCNVNKPLDAEYTVRLYGRVIARLCEFHAKTVRDRYPAAEIKHISPHRPSAPADPHPTR